MKRLIVFAAAAAASFAAVIAPGLPAHALHSHQGNCHGDSRYNSICLDPTTGFGPVLYVFLGTTNYWDVGVSDICEDGEPNTFFDFDNGDIPPNYPQRYAEGGIDMLYQTNDNGDQYSVSRDGYNFNCPTAQLNVAATMTQTVYNQVKFVSDEKAVWFITCAH